MSITVHQATIVSVLYPLKKVSVRDALFCGMYRDRRCIALEEDYNMTKVEGSSRPLSYGPSTQVYLWGSVFWHGIGSLQRPRRGSV